LKEAQLRDADKTLDGFDFDFNKKMDRLPRRVRPRRQGNPISRRARAHLRRLAKVQVLVLDDFGLEPLGAAERKVLLEVLEDRYGLGATILTSQLDPKDWHPVIGDETVADAICDRLVHGAHRIKLMGESLRKGLTNGTKPAK
jgi:DNA replication protein DnaC